MSVLTPLEQSIVDGMLARAPQLATCLDSLLSLHAALVTCYDHGGKLLTCGNGGSHADAVHIVGELCKSFERKRPLPVAFRERLSNQPMGADLAAHLEAGLAAVTLGCNSALKTAVENDSPLRDMAFAQETYALIGPQDVLLAISTSGNATNCLLALSVAKAVGAKTVLLTGPKGGKMGDVADIVLRAPGSSTAHVQENHLVLYHTFCQIIEAHYFPEKR